MSEEIIQGVKGAAKFLGVHRDTIHRHIKSGTFPNPITMITLGETEEKNIRTWKKKNLVDWKTKQDEKPGRGWKIGKKRVEY